MNATLRKKGVSFVSRMDGVCMYSFLFWHDFMNKFELYYCLHKNPTIEADPDTCWPPESGVFNQSEAARMEENHRKQSIDPEITHSCKGFLHTEHSKLEASGGENTETEPSLMWHQPAALFLSAIEFISQQKSSHRTKRKSRYYLVKQQFNVHQLLKLFFYDGKRGSKTE